MENNAQRKARLILAGLAALPTIATAQSNPNKVQFNAYCSPYTDECVPEENLSKESGLSRQELNESRQLVKELNQLDVVTATQVNIERAPRQPYNMPPLQSDIDEARKENLERLAKLRTMIEAAR